ncbi:hypothetical protein [Streptococcus suis]|uniref:hypothetical protein n=1 Tax=Streptococcus suis TaxID=1307 RepID=UPI000CF6E8AA|nr:hypothetical protein [Streptococcus suis]
MNTYSKEELMEMLGYSFQVLKAVKDLDDAILRVQDRAANKITGNYIKLRSWYNKALAIFILFCIVLGALQGKYALGMHTIFQFLLIYVVFWALFSPILAMINFVFKYFAKREFVKAKTNDESNAYRQKGRELLKDKQFLEYKSIIPSTYFNMNDLYLLYSYLENFRADNFKEAANLLSEEKHRDNVEYNQAMMKDSLRSIQNNVRYQSVMQTIQLLETAKIRSSIDSLF